MVMPRTMRIGRAGGSGIMAGVGLVLVATAATPPDARAEHIQRQEVDVLRRAIGPGEGYLNFASGAEYTGHTDAQGRDWADNHFSVKPIIVAGASGAAPANVNIATDFDYMRKVYAQAGLAVLNEPVGSVQASYDPPYFENQIFRANPAFGEAVASTGRSANANTINLYFLNAYINATLRGVSVPPDLAGLVDYDAATVVDARTTLTAAHEIGHMLLNEGGAVHMQMPTDPAHSSDPSNFIASGAVNPPQPNALFMVGPQQIARTGVMEPGQIQLIFSNPGDDNPGYVTAAGHPATHGDVVDFDWVSDQLVIEGITGASNGADLGGNGGSDYLVWEISAGAVAPSGHIGPGSNPHEHGSAGTFPSLPGFGGESFQTIDVFSNVNRYADNDSPLLPDRFAGKHRALDYTTPQFSEDGKEWFDARLAGIYKPGWTQGATSDDYVARWISRDPQKKPKFVRFKATGVDNANHDGNTQIDAIIAHASVVRSLLAIDFRPAEEHLVSDGPGTYVRFDSRPVTGSSAPTARVETHLGLLVDVTQPSFPDLAGRVEAVTGDGGAEEFLDRAEMRAVLHQGPGMPVIPDQFAFGLLNPIVDSNDRLGHIVPGSGGQLFEYIYAPDASFIDILFDVAFGGGDDALVTYMIHGEILLDGYMFEFADAVGEAGTGGMTTSDLQLLFVLSRAEDTIGEVIVGGTTALGATLPGDVPAFSLSISAATTEPIPEPAGAATMLVGATAPLLLRRRRRRSR